MGNHIQNSYILSKISKFIQIRFLFYRVNKWIRIKLWLFILLLKSIAFCKTVLLVPGFFNTAVPSDSIEKRNGSVYWSQEIKNVFIHSGYKVFVADTLNPVGTIEQNGEILLNYILNIESQYGDDGPLTVIAHSAGGLYTLYANSKRELPIRKMITINTPFDGVDFIGSLLRYYPNFIGMIEKSFKIQSINELSPIRVRRVLSHIKSPPKFPIYAYKGYQPTGYNFLDASFLSPVFYITGLIVGMASDGIVTHKSALGYTPYLSNIIRMNDDYIRLDHWKQSAGAGLFRYLGMTNIDYIREEQIRFYTMISNRL